MIEEEQSKKESEKLQLELDFERKTPPMNGMENQKEKLKTAIRPDYSLAIRAVSLGQDKNWKKLLVKHISSKIKVSGILDIDCGTGELSSALSKKYPEAQITGIDTDKDMITRASMINLDENVKFMISDISNSNIKNDVYDIITGGFALGNSQDLGDVLKEVGRVMKSGAYAAFLDLCKTPIKWLQPVQIFFIGLWCKVLGLIFHSNTGIYDDITDNLKKMPDCKKMVSIIENAGFRNVRSVKFLLGSLEILLFEK